MRKASTSIYHTLLDLVFCNRISRIRQRISQIDAGVRCFYTVSVETEARRSLQGLLFFLFPLYKTKKEESSV